MESRQSSANQGDSFFLFPFTFFFFVYYIFNIAVQLLGGAMYALKREYARGNEQSDIT